MARRFGQKEVLSQFITVHKLVYIAFINLAVAFGAPMHQDIIGSYRTLLALGSVPGRLIAC